MKIKVKKTSRHDISRLKQIQLSDSSYISKLITPLISVSALIFRNSQKNPLESSSAKSHQANKKSNQRKETKFQVVCNKFPIQMDFLPLKGEKNPQKELIGKQVQI